MAGSLSHIVNENGEFIGVDLLDHLGDSYEALSECFYIIGDLSGWDHEKINAICEKRKYPKIDKITPREEES